MEYIDVEIDDAVGEPFWETPWWSDDMRPAIREKDQRGADAERTPIQSPSANPRTASPSIRKSAWGNVPAARPVK